MKLTDACVAKLVLPAGKSDHIEWDSSLPGFGVRLRRGSKRVSAIIQYRIGTQQRREALATFADRRRRRPPDRPAAFRQGRGLAWTRQERTEARAQARRS